MIPNYNEETGIHYGYISASSLNNWTVDILLYENGTDHTFEEYRKSRIEKLMLKHATEDQLDFDQAQSEAWLNNNLDSDWEQEIGEFYCCEEPTVSGEYEGVNYLSTWENGALCFLISKSPVVTHKASECSPCVPKAGMIDTLEGDYTCYNVPDDWRADSGDLE